MTHRFRSQLLIVSVAAVVMFAGLGSARLWDQDEAFFARAAVEMHERGEWVVPYFNGEVFAHKPPLMFWLMRTGFLLFGVNEFAARFWSAVFGIGTALLTYTCAKRMFNERVGLIAGLAMSTALMFDVVARAATPDSFLVFFSMLALYVFIRHEQWETRGDTNATSLSPLPWKACAAMYAAMGLAVLVKGPIGVVLPGCVVGLYLLVRMPRTPQTGHDTLGDRIQVQAGRFTPANIARTMWAMRPLTAIAAVLLVAGPWFAAVEWKTGGGFLGEFFGVHNYGRFLSAMDNHRGPLWYYVPAVLIGFFPWSIFGIPTALQLVRSVRGGDEFSRGAKFIACWISVYLGFFSLAGTKLPSYVLPAYPALAIATALFIDRWLQQPARVWRWWPRLSFGSLLLVGGVLATAGFVVSSASAAGDSSPSIGIGDELRGDLFSLVWLGGVLMVGGAVGMVLIARQRREIAVSALALTAVAFALVLFGGVAVQIDRHQPSPDVATIVQLHAGEQPRVAQFGYFRPSLVYYTGTSVENCKSPPEVAEFLTGDSQAVVITTAEHYRRLQPELPADVSVIGRRADFPQMGEVVVLKRETNVASRRSGSRETSAQ